MTLRLSDGHAAAIRSHGRDTYPEECCGVLIGHERGTPEALVVTVSEVRRLPNVKEDERDRRYIIDPMAVLAIEDELDERAEDDRRIVGIYHSHPDHPARPSEFDRDHALPGWSYVVLRVAAGTDEAMTSWRLKEDRSAFVEQPIEHPLP